MAGVSAALQWWEESQLRILVIASLVIQYILLVGSVARRYPIRSWFRPIIWLAYLGSDAIAIYGLATLFNRHRKPQNDGDEGILELLWAPILLIHLGGQDGITAYNIEDNELWTRHILTSVSQVTVAVYVFWKSWQGRFEKILLAAAQALFIPGILKCIEKPLAFNRASINSLVSLGEPIRRSIHTHKLRIDPLEDFIDKATSPIGASEYLLTSATPVDFTPYKLFVDLASPSVEDRIRVLLSFSTLDGNHAYCKLQHWLSNTFLLLYTKKKDSLSATGNIPRWVVGVLGCADFLQQHWHMKSCSSSLSITKLVLQYVKDGWKHHIKDVSSYRKFNDNRGQFTLGHEGCYEDLGWSLDGAFDESVLLWHLATDFCYYDTVVSRSHHGLLCTQDSCPHAYACPAWCKRSGHHKRAIRCREMSNYMMYLLFLNPEMLMAGTRRNLCTTAYDELKDIVEEREKIDGTIVEGDEEIGLTQMIYATVDGGGSPPPGCTQQQQGGIVRDAWSIARVLSNLPEEKMWGVIEGVWVEMLCFSAARCRGYLHAKGLGTGVEYLTYVWLLLYYIGMETLAAKLQRADHHYHHNGGEHGDAPSSSHVSTAQEEAAGPSRSNGGATEEEHAKGQSATCYHDSDEIVEEMV
ncbi:hypothetical protein TRIUR3_03453 [Triticum urartu]|uniref:Uncharacterized protein n=1 Tax=Triticum urartu TaxID=4572 RepID=M7YM78_TRIUA|nr:hypothetical protein TRIUR3_03453 [Triticum urartu]